MPRLESAVPVSATPSPVTSTVAVPLLVVSTLMMRPDFSAIHAPFARS